MCIELKPSHILTRLGISCLCPPFPPVFIFPLLHPLLPPPLYLRGEMVESVLGEEGAPQLQLTQSKLTGEGEVAKRLEAATQFLRGNQQHPQLLYYNIGSFVTSDIASCSISSTVAVISSGQFSKPPYSCGECDVYCTCNQEKEITLARHLVFTGCM